MCELVDGRCAACGAEPGSNIDCGECAGTQVAIGDVVDYHARVGFPATQRSMRVRAVGKLNDLPVAWLDGKAGCVWVAALTHRYRE